MIEAAGRWRGLAAVAAALSSGVLAQGGAGATEPARFELSSGFGATQDTRFGHGAVVWAFGRDLREEGVRLRLAAGRGIYRYATASVPGTDVVFGSATILDLLAGRQWRRDGLFVKAYLGVAFARHDLTPDDPGNRVAGGRTGAKGAVEAWWDLGSRHWVSADATYATHFGDYWSQVRLGYRARRWLSLGVEAGLLGNRGHDALRAGALARLDLGGSEVTIAGGATRAYRDRAHTPYLAVSVDRRF